MHLFLIDLYVSVDMLSPIIHVLNKKQKVLICGINPNQSFKEDIHQKADKDDHGDEQGKDNAHEDEEPSLEDTEAVLAFTRSLCFGDKLV